MEKIMNDNDSKAFLKEMARLYPKYKDNFGAVSNLIVLLMEELQKERKGRKRGEKFEKIVEGIYRALNPIRAFKSITIQDRSDILRNIQHILEQKYFPKEE